MIMRKSPSSFQKPQTGKATSDPFNDSNQLLNPGSPSSGRRVSFSVPEHSACHSPKGGPSMSDNPFTDSPTYQSPQIALNRIPSYSTASSSNRTLPLKSQLQNCFLPSEYGTRVIKFLPRSAVDDLIDRQSVEEYWEALEHSSPHEPLSDVLDYIFGTRNARFVFVIIVLMGEPSLLGNLMQERVCDDDLPLSHVEVQGADSEFGRKSKDGSIVPVACFSTWSAAQVNYFGQLQRQVKATVLEDWPIQLRVTEVPSHSILPLMRCRRIHDGNSEVFQVEVHHAHHRFKDSTKPATDRENTPFALKVLEAKDQLTFNLEVKALMKIRPNQHLVTAVTAFKYQDRYHLLFNWAEGGTLADFWKTQSPNLTHSSICWLAQQCHGLADGLCGIHRAQISVQELADVDPQHGALHPEANAELDDHDKIHGRHGDIKPDNILWFSDEENEYMSGVLKITDFGVTAFHNAKTTKQPAKQVPRTITYAAPEIEVSHDEDEPLVSRPFDIWSLGCVYLEFITWILLGNEGLLEFEKRRMEEKVTRRRFQEDSFYSIYRRGRLNPWSRDYGAVKTSVVYWTDTLRENERCTPFLREFLDYIQKKMLVVKTRRENSAMVRAQLRRMLDTCQQDRQYAESRPSRQTGHQNWDSIHMTGSKWKRVMKLLCG